VLTGPEARVSMATADEEGDATLEIAEGGRLEVGDRIEAGREDGGGGARRIALDGGTLVADSLEMWAGTLMGAGMLSDGDASDGFASLVDSSLLVGSVLEGGGLVAGRGDLSVVGDIVMSGGTLGFTRLAGAAPDQLLIEGGLEIAGATLNVDWQGAPPDPDSLSAYRLIRASDGITLDGLTLETSLAGAPVTYELRADGRELWLLAGDGAPPPPVARVSGTILTRSGNPFDGVAVNFASDSGGVETVTSGPAGTFAFEVATDSSGQISATQDYSLAAGDPRITTASALEALRISVGLTPSWGPAGAMDYIAADFNDDGRVTTADALGILRVAVGLSAEAAPRWIFLDAEADLAEVSRSNTEVAQGLRLGPVTSDIADLGLVGILVGHVQDYT
jgi:hypothetical protein